MTYDYYALIGKQISCPKNINEFGLAPGFVDECTVWACKEKQQGQKVSPKDEARQRYIDKIKQVKNFVIPDEPDFSSLPDSQWLGIKVDFTLETPWYSKDDRPFHALDNPVLKDRVSGVPFMSAASWKGMLRWACHMQAGLVDHLKTNKLKMDGWMDGWMERSRMDSSPFRKRTRRNGKR